MQNLEKKGTFKQKPWRILATDWRRERGQGGSVLKSLRTRHNIICSLSICASVKGNTVQTKPKSGKSGQCSVLVRQVLPTVSLYCCHLHSPQELHLHVLCWDTNKSITTQWYKQPKLQVSALHTFLGSPFYIQRLCECLWENHYYIPTGHKMLQMPKSGFQIHAKTWNGK